MNLANNIEITNAIARATKWRTVRVEDFDQEATPYAVVTVQVCGADKGGVPFSNTYGTYRLIAMDSTASIVLRRKAAPQNYYDEFEVKSLVVSGLYAAVMAAYNANVTGANQTRKRCLAVDAIAVSSGLLGPEFATT